MSPIYPYARILRLDNPEDGSHIYSVQPKLPDSLLVEKLQPHIAGEPRAVLHKDSDLILEDNSLFI